LKTLLTIDIGTSSTKVSLFSVHGKLLASYQESYPIHYPEPGWAEQDPRAWWEAACRVSDKVIREAGAPTVAVVVVSGQTPSCVPVDEDGLPLRPAILWLDRRAHDQVSWLDENLGLDLAVAQTGNTLDSYFGGVKWLWFKQKEPERYKQTWKILQASSYIIYHLTGQVVLDHSQAGLCSPCYNIYVRDWDHEICKTMGIDLAKLPDLKSANQIIGAVSTQAARVSGIPAGTPVTAGGGDFAFSCLGAGVFEPGEAVLMLGTAGNLLVADPAASDPRLINTIHILGGMLSLGGVLAGGSVTWFKDMLRWEGDDFYTRMETEAEGSPPGAQGLVFTPYLMGERTPIWDQQARGAFFGLSHIHHRGHLYRAVLEGVAYAFRGMLEIVTGSGTQIEKITLTDGGAQSMLWRQIFADVLGRPVSWQPTSGGTAMGAAISGALACGALSDPSAIKNWFGPTIDIYPDRATAETYASNFQVFQDFYPRVREFFPLIS
jgi:sugar (pentulose or hexulose) kinase